MKRSILLHENDTVITLLSAAEPGETFSVVDGSGTERETITAAEAVPFAHKIAIKEMKKGDKVIKLNTTIGLASEDIPVGSYAHVHNISSIEGRRGVK